MSLSVAATVVSISSRSLGDLVVAARTLVQQDLAVEDGALAG